MPSCASTIPAPETRSPIVTHDKDQFLCTNLSQQHGVKNVTKCGSLWAIPGTPNLMTDYQWKRLKKCRVLPSALTSPAPEGPSASTDKHTSPLDTRDFTAHHYQNHSENFQVSARWKLQCLVLGDKDRDTVSGTGVDAPNPKRGCQRKELPQALLRESPEPP
jgi:hypothetical protein